MTFLKSALTYSVFALLASAPAYAGCTSSCLFKLALPGIQGSGPSITLVTDNTTGALHYSNGTYASSCQAYLQPTDSNHAAGTNSGIYAIPVGSSVLPVYCNQTSNGGGWALLMKQAMGDGTTLEGDTTYWTSGATLNDTSSNQNMNDGNFVSAAFTSLPVTQLMLQAANETTVQTQTLAMAESALAAFRATPLQYTDGPGTPLATPNWFIRTSTYPDGSTLDQARLGFNFVEYRNGNVDCAVRWGWTMNQDANTAPGSDDFCGGLGAYGIAYGSTYMNSSKNTGQPATIYLWGK